MNCCFELDDFQTDEISLFALTEFKRRNPKFKATYFTLYGKCDLAILKDIAKLDWVELAVHGLDHQTEHLWGYCEMQTFLRSVVATGLFSKVFKMPWFDVPSEGVLRALSEFGFKYATRREMQLSALKKHKIPTYLGCPWTVYAHPPTLPKKLEEVDIWRYDEFFTVSEMFEVPIAKKNGWIRTWHTT